MRVLITGATGLIGQEIVQLCHSENIDVSYLTTKKSKISHSSNYQGYYWKPKSGEIDTSCFKNIDAIIQLAGASISKRWTSKYKEEILSSRVQGTELLVNSLKGESHNIKQVISSSAIGIYPNSFTHYYEESFKEVNPAFLGDVVQSWERSVDSFSKVGIKVTKVRTGLVLSNKGGALTQMVRPIKYGFGANLGDGKQWQSWIHVKDLAHMFMFLIKYKLSGVYNGVSPNAVTNKEFTKTIAKVLNRPLILPNIPKFVLKSILGEMHTLLFDSQRVSSEKIESKGFVFQYHHLKQALQDLLG